MKPVKPKPEATAGGTGGKTFDPLLDSLPQPDVVESDSDTAWGLWQESIMPVDTVKGPLARDSGFRESVYKDTEPMGLPEAEATHKKRPSGSDSSS